MSSCVVSLRTGVSLFIMRSHTCWNDLESPSPILGDIAKFSFHDRSTPYQPSSGWLHRLAGSRMVDITVGFVTAIPLLIFVRVFFSPLSRPSVALLTDVI